MGRKDFVCNNTRRVTVTLDHEAFSGRHGAGGKDTGAARGTRGLAGREPVRKQIGVEWPFSICNGNAPTLSWNILMTPKQGRENFYFLIFGWGLTVLMVWIVVKPDFLIQTLNHYDHEPQNSNP